MSRHVVAAIGAIALAAYVAVHALGIAEAPIHSDGYSYYVYLPSWFLYHDPTLQRVADDCCGGSFPAFTSIVRWPETGRWVDPHPIGVALLMMPFAAAAHGLTLWTNLPPDGFSPYYQHAAGLAGLTAFCAGLWLLRRLLLRHFSDSVTIATLLATTFGTNLFHYATFDSTFSHAFSFFLIAALLEETDRWYTAPDWRTSLQLTVISALIVLTRHTNAIYLLLIPLAGPREFWRRRREVMSMAGLGAICLLPQLAIYRRATGHWFVSVYAELGVFDLRAPKALAVLVGSEKGLFVWSPLLLLAAAGWFVDHPLLRRWRAAAAAIFLLNLYLIAGWSDWQFGGSFGHRGFTDGLAIGAVGLAAWFDRVAARRGARVATAVAVTALVLLSTFQMLQYWNGILPIADTTWAEYGRLFLRWR